MSVLDQLLALADPDPPTGEAILPLPSSTFSFDPFPLPSLPLRPLRRRPLKVLGERCKLSQRGLGRSPAEIEFGAF